MCVLCMCMSIYVYMWICICIDIYMLKWCCQAILPEFRSRQWTSTEDVKLGTKLWDDEYLKLTKGNISKRTIKKLRWKIRDAHCWNDGAEYATYSQHGKVLSRLMK